MSKPGINDERAAQLYDLLADGPLTRPEIVEETGWSESQLTETIQVLRDTLAANKDEINVVCEPQGQREPWLYSMIDGKDIISGALSGGDGDGYRWTGININGVERRITTLIHVLGAAVKATKGNTTLGQKARIYHRHLVRAQEDVAELVATK